MREETYMEPCPGSFTLVALDEDAFVRLPDGTAAVGQGIVWIAKTLTGRLFHALDGCVTSVSLAEVV